MSGGGGSSQTVDYPKYMKSWHSAWMDILNTDMLEAQDANPFVGLSEITDPDATFGARTVTPYGALSSLCSSDIGSIYTDVYYGVQGESNNAVNHLVLAHGANLDARMNQTVLPRFRAGMRDIGAVTSSAFSIGVAIIEAANTDDLGRATAEFRVRALDIASEMSKLFVEKLRLCVAMATEIARIYTAAKVDVDKWEMDKAVKREIWDLETYQYAGNMLAAISGAAVLPKPPSGVQTALGGALSGAAMGATVGSMFGPGYGTAIGAAIGGAVGLITSFF